MKALVCALSLVLIMVSVVKAGTALEFTPKEMLDWSHRSLKGKSDYQLLESGKGIKAKAESSASGLFCEQEIDVKTMPWLSWRWRAVSFPDVQDEAAKEGDDFVLRLYVLVKPGWTMKSAKGVVYVWSSQESPDESWPNPFATDNIVTVPLRGRSEIGSWVDERRNVREDFKRYLGLDVNTVEVIAIMTDADNGKSRAEGEYGRLQFAHE
ncbi:DUF3047 domain-containing protein [Parasalinivibrio latis]|uniref:DUF3047 domain-containing protein n=1 Tax=Parasalinivibrio latis TaxID=2952610 RepID=UPI0030E19350